jgi:hypothetical protein
VQAWRTLTIERPLLHVTSRREDGTDPTNSGGGEDEDGWEEEEGTERYSKPHNWE